MATSSSTITAELTTLQLISFIAGNFPTAGASVITTYLSFGKETTAWGDEDNPDTAVSGTASALFRADIEGGVRLYSGSMAPVIARVNWADIDPLTLVTNDVVITDEHNVYLCEANITSTVKPIHTVTGTANNVNNYRFLYKIANATYIENFETAEYIPVWFGSNTVSLNEDGTDYTADANSIILTNAATLMITGTLNTSLINTTDLALYRKVALWSNITDTAGLLISADSFLTADIDTTSGLVWYVSHRPPVTRVNSQMTKYSAILGF